MNFFVLIVLLFFVAIPIGQAVAKLIEARAETRPLPPADAERMRRLEGRVRELTERVDRLSDEQEFMTRLLERRAGRGLPPHNEERSDDQS